MSTAYRPLWFTQALLKTPQQHMLPVDHISIQCLSWGNPGRHAIIFLHGGFANAYWFAHIAPELAKDFFVLALDFSGHGQSDWRDAYHLQDFQRELEATIAYFSLTSVTLAGFSFGARIAYLYAQHHAEMVSQLILIDPPMVTKPVPIDFLSTLKSQTLRHYPDRQSILKRFRLIPKQPVENTYITDFIAQKSIKSTSHGYTWQSDPNLFTKFVSAPDDPANRLRTLPMCTLVYGDRSAISTPASHQIILNQFPDIKLHRIANAHHAIMIDQPLAFISALQQIIHYSG